MKLKAIRLLRLLPVLMLVLSMWTAVLTGACSNAPPPLSESDETARQSFSAAIEGSNQWKRWSDDLPTSAALGPDTQTWNKKLQELSYSISRAESVPNEFLSRVHPDLQVMWREFFIPFLKVTHSYYYRAVNQPESIMLPSTEEGRQQLQLLTDAHTLDEIFGAWYREHHDAVSDGILRLAGG